MLFGMVVVIAAITYYLISAILDVVVLLIFGKWTQVLGLNNTGKRLRMAPHGRRIYFSLLTFVSLTVSVCLRWAKF
ncbi:hypothetical protein TSUD_264210 [Trifolium subterraneum]|uniref:Uncharacterized protein n=1 Tax=Trifolium subterraneum TaxID=3900 RepID=A0A2Z6N152_TRISU|nr:hypothetical protein TSUD_264210 [Trifolium subterraneum]